MLRVKRIKGCRWSQGRTVGAIGAVQVVEVRGFLKIINIYMLIRKNMNNINVCFNIFNIIIILN